MGDFLILTEKRWPLRQAIADLNLDGFTRHPDKTQAGRLGRGFYWCGVQFTAGQSPCISNRSLTTHRERCRRLDEQLWARGMAEEVTAARVSAYRVRWSNWAGSILNMAGNKGISVKTKNSNSTRPALRAVCIATTIAALMPAQTRVVVSYLRRQTIRHFAGIVACIVACLSGNAHALEYEWPVLTSLRVELTSATSANYYLTWSTVHVSDPTILPSHTVQDVYEMKKGARYANLTSSIVHRHKNDSGVISANGFSMETTSYLNERFEEYWPRVVDRLTRQSMISHVGVENGNECVGAFMNYGLVHPLWDAFVDSSWDGGVGSAGTCLGTPPVNQWCALTTPAVTFSYGTMTLGQAPGAVRQETVGVECTTGMKYTLRLMGENNVPLSNGMRAELQADGKPLTTAIDGQAGQNTVSLTSTLVGEPDRTGEFRGESVLFVSYP